MNLPETLAETLGRVLPVAVEDDGALTVTYGETVASLRTMEIAEGLQMVWVMQILGRDLPLSGDLGHQLADRAATTMFGSVTLTERPGGLADVTMRYMFPASGLTERALQNLVLMVLDAGAEIARELV